MRVVQVLFELLAKNNLSPEAAKAARQADQDAKKRAEEQKKFFNSFERGLMLINNAVATSKALWHGFRETVVSAVERALEFRFQGDFGRQQFEALERSLKTLQARLGDVFMPLIIGVSQTMRPLIANFEKWLKVNEDLIASRIIAWTVQLSTALVQGVALATLGVTKAWYGWKLIIQSVATVFSSFIAGAMEKVAGASLAFESLFRAAGEKDLADKLKGVGTAAAKLWKEFEGGAEVGQREILKTIHDLEAQEAAINNVADVLTRAIGQAGVAAMRALGVETHRANENADELAKRTQAWNDAIRSAVSSAEAYFDRLAQIAAEKDAVEISKLVDRRTQAFLRIASDAEKLDQRLAAGVDHFAGMFAGVFMDAFSGGFHDIGELFDKLLMTLAQQLVGAAVFKFFQALFASALTGPGALPFLNLFGFAEGGPVTGGIPGRDSVPALLTPGEYVLPVHVVDEIRRGAGPGGQPVQRFADGGLVARPQVAGGITVNLSQSFLVPPTSAQTQRAIRDGLLPVLRGLAQRGEAV